MNILALSAWFPFPPNNGSKIRIFNLLKYLSAKHEIDLLTMRGTGEGSPEDIAILQRWCRNVKAVSKKTYRPNHWRSWLGLFSPWPRVHTQIFSPEMRDLVTAEIGASRFDLGIAFQFDTARYLLGFENLPRVLEEVELADMRDNVTRASNSFRRFRYRPTEWKTRRFVNRLLREFDFCTVVSQQENNILRTIAPDYASVAVIPNGTDVSFYTGDFGQPQPDTLIFSGALTYSANFDAVAFFLREVLPLIRKEKPRTILRITGNTMGVPLVKLPQPEGVFFTGYLDDVRSLVAQSWACVVPIRKGGGTRLKILEAMALGTPVVSTTKGAEGLDVTHGEHILTAGDPAEFARHTLAVLNDVKLRTHLATNARRLVETTYDWKLAGAKFEALLQEVVERRRA